MPAPNTARNVIFVSQLERNGSIRNPIIAEAFRKTDRGNFVLREFYDEAYTDAPIPIYEGVTTSQPSTIAFMLEQALPREGHKVLEIGTGSGYLTALLAHLVGYSGNVYSIEYLPALNQFAEMNLSRYDFPQIHLLIGDGREGMPQEAPFDIIISSIQAKEIPRAWEEQLRSGGVIVAPLEKNIIVARKNQSGVLNCKNFPFFLEA